MNRARTSLILGTGFAFGLTTLVLLGWLTYRDLTATEISIREVDHTYRVLNKLDNIFSSLKDAEAGQRGYVITGKKEYLEPYYKEAGSIEEGLSTLRDMTVNNPQQQKRLDDIEPLVRVKLALLKKTIDMSRAKAFRFASHIMQTGVDEVLTEQIRMKVANAREEEVMLLQERSTARRYASHRLVWAIVAGGSLSITLLLTAFLFLRREIGRRIKVEGELRSHQDGLENLVQKRTRDIVIANSLLTKEVAMRKHAEKDLKKAIEDLARSNKELDQFAAIASHDLQSPLRTVAGFVDILARDYRGKLDEKANEYITRVENGTRRMSGLLHDLYVYSRIGTQGKQLTTVDMAAVLNGAVDNLKEVIDGNTVAITSDELPYVEGDDTQLMQLLQNLIGNAIKFRKKDIAPTIRISVQHRDREWVFGVHDNGIGIAPQFYDRIFEIFQRLHTSEEYPGTGLGLALCKKIVDRHGGRIWIESRPDDGSSFYFTVPASRTLQTIKSQGEAL
jgi:signal transduction histidine kinase